MQKTLPPATSVWLAQTPYDVREIKAGQNFNPKAKELTRFFDFSRFRLSLLFS